MVSVTSLRFMQSAVRPEGLGSPTSQRDSQEFGVHPYSSLSLGASDLASDIRQLLSPTKAATNKPGPDTLPAVDEAPQASPGRRRPSAERRVLELQLEQIEQSEKDLRLGEQQLANDQNSLSQMQQKIEAEQQRFEVERGELDEDRRNFLLQRVHAADDDMIRCEKDLLVRCKELEASKREFALHKEALLNDELRALQESRKIFTAQQAELAREKLLLADEHRKLQLREESVAEQERRLAGTLNPLEPWPPWVASTRASGAHARGRLGRWCVGLIVVVVAVSASLRHAAPNAPPLWPTMCRVVRDRIRCLPALPLSPHRAV